MAQQEFWQRFAATGAVADYLRYRGDAARQEKKERDGDVTADQDDRRGAAGSKNGGV